MAPTSTPLRPDAPQPERHPRVALPSLAAGSGPDYDIVGRGCVEQIVEIYRQRPCERHEHVETDRAAPGSIRLTVEALRWLRRAISSSDQPALVRIARRRDRTRASMAGCSYIPTAAVHDRLDAVLGRRSDTEHGFAHPDFSDVVIADDPAEPTGGAPA